MTSTQLKSDVSESCHDIDDETDDSYFKTQKINSLKRFREKYPNGIGKITEFNFLNTSTTNMNQKHENLLHS